MTPRFLQIHTLHSYPGVLLNRDDAGLAKRLPFGGVVRTRISSQCLKRHWRMADDEYSLDQIGVPMGIRSRVVVEERIMKGVAGDPDALKAIASVLQKVIYGNSGEEKRSRQALLLGEPEVAWFREQAMAVAREATDAKDATKRMESLFKDRKIKASVAALKHHAGLEAALFGRMVTSDPAANTDAAIHVAHAFTVHGEESESDYFTVVDDLSDREAGDDSGAAGVFDQELTSGLYYGYVVVDVPRLVANLEGCAPEEWLKADRSLASQVVQHLLHLIAKVSPGAKRGGTAPYGWAELMLVEAGERQPRTLANAFRRPVKGNDLFAVATDQLGSHLQALDDCYGVGEARRYASPSLLKMNEAPRLTFESLTEWARKAVAAGSV
jgi:CRISPR system Cascade subunit CasC